MLTLETSMLYIFLLYSMSVLQSKVVLSTISESVCCIHWKHLALDVKQDSSDPIFASESNLLVQRLMFLQCSTGYLHNFV